MSHEVKINQSLVSRMYLEHNYSVDDICLRLRYPKELVTELIQKLNQNSINCNTVDLIQ
jgi:hypothetical protein